MTTPYDGPDRRATQGWHLKREIQFSHLLTTLTIALSAATYIVKIEQRLAVVENQVIAQRDRDARQDQAIAEGMALLRHQLEIMDAKLDRLLVRGAPRPSTASMASSLMHESIDRLGRLLIHEETSRPAAVAVSIDEPRSESTSAAH